MSKGDITYFHPGLRGTKSHQVTSGGTPPAINAGEPVQKTLGNQYVITAANGTPVVATNYWVGIAAGTPGSAGTSTETSTAAGNIEVADFLNGDVFLANPVTAATWATQALYNALVGARVTMQNSSQVFKINASDGSTNGLVIENLSLASYPGKVAFSIRAGAAYLA
jgi:hypothetical protein